jgi:hypothetical protein
MELRWMAEYTELIDVWSKWTASLNVAQQTIDADIVHLLQFGVSIFSAQVLQQWVEFL